MAVVRARLDGADAELGRVPAADIARLILGLERAIAHAAYVVLGESRRGTGRHRQAIENASRLRFVAVERGSVVGLLALPDADPSDDELPVPVPHLGFLAFQRVLDVIGEEGPDADVELAGAVAQLATELGIGERNATLTLASEPPTPTGEHPRQAVLDAVARARLHTLAGRPQPAGLDQSLVGTLFEADFEQETAKLRLPTGELLSVSYRSELADDIYEALRTRARVEGLVTYDPRTSEATHVELRAVARSTQPPLDAESFWQPVSFTALQETQGTTGRFDPSDLAITDLTDEERHEFLAALAE